VNVQRYHLFRIETEAGDETFIIAEDELKATEIYSCTFVLKDGEHRLYRVFLWEDRLPDHQRLMVLPILHDGPTGVATWCRTCGWSIAPPG
jgi:hypothetical protein